MNSVAAPATAKAVFDAQLAGKVAVTGITLPSALRTYVKNLLSKLGTNSRLQAAALAAREGLVA